MFDFLTEKLSSVFSRITGQRSLTERNIADTLAKVKEALIEADVPLSVVNLFIERVKEGVVGKKILAKMNPSEQFVKIVHDQLVHFLGAVKTDDQFLMSWPSTIVVMGLQGSGKTTTIGKLAYYAARKAQAEKKRAPRILCASVDFYRPAAIEQLEIGARGAGAAFLRARSTDPLAATREITAEFKKGSYDLLFLDTAGRLHIDNHMLRELDEVIQIVRPTKRILVLDAMTGQESLRVAQAFDQAVGFDAGILTKIDSDTRAGAAFAFCYELQKPLLFLGAGEKREDLELFRPERMATRILGMGDIETLLEKAEEKLSASTHEKAAKNMARGTFTFNDFASQIELLNSMGSFAGVLKYIPGAAGAANKQKMEEGERKLKRFKAIINSMTPKERLNHKLLDGSRRKRIAKGSGVAVSEINTMIAEFEQMQQFVKLIGKSGKFPF